MNVSNRTTVQVMKERTNLKLGHEKVNVYYRKIYMGTRQV